jgi:hypothetical protein
MLHTSAEALEAKIDEELVGGSWYRYERRETDETLASDACFRRLENYRQAAC